MIKNITDLKKADNFFLLAGPCVIEGEEMALRIAEHIVTSEGTSSTLRRMDLGAYPKPRTIIFSLQLRY